MPRVCTICSHGRREEIDRALLAGGSFRSIAAQFEVSASALLRHRAHIAAAVAQSQALTVERLLSDLADLQARALKLLTQAEEGGDLRIALQGVRETRGCIETAAKLLELSDLEKRVQALEEAKEGTA